MDMTNPVSGYKMHLVLQGSSSYMVLNASANSPTLLVDATGASGQVFVPGRNFPIEKNLHERAR